MDEQEKLFLEIREDKDGNEFKVMKDEKARKICIETFLAFHSFEIGNPAKPKQFICLEFTGDKELYDAMVDPSKYSSLVRWTDYEGYEGENKDEILMLKDDTSKFTTAYIKIWNTDKTSLIYELAFRFDSFELYSEVPLPWMIKNSEGIGKLVYLSRSQKETFFEGGLKVHFYINKDRLEPLIVDERKAGMLSKITTNIISNVEKPKEGEVLLLKFINGDRDILSAYSGTIRYKYFEVVKIETLEETYRYKLQNITYPIITMVYRPESDDLLYYGVSSY